MFNIKCQHARIPRMSPWCAKLYCYLQVRNMRVTSGSRMNSRTCWTTLHNNNSSVLLAPRCTAAKLTLLWPVMIRSHGNYHLSHCNVFLCWYIPRRATVVAGDWCILQIVQLHVIVELLRRAWIQRLRKVLHLCHEVIHVLLYGGEIQREALGGITSVRPVCGRRWRASWLWVAATPEPPCAKSSRLHQHQEQHWWNHSDRCHLIRWWNFLPSNATFRPENSFFLLMELRKTQ